MCGASYGNASQSGSASRPFDRAAAATELQGGPCTLNDVVRREAHTRHRNSNPPSRGAGRVAFCARTARRSVAVRPNVMQRWYPDEKTRDAWATAARDAEFDAAIVHLFVAQSTGSEYGAMHYPPGMWAVPGDNTFDFSDGLRVRIRELVDEHVTVVAEGQSDDLRLLVLRHEAEHVAQDLLHPPNGQVGLRLYSLFGDAYYGASPHERDADAAATAMRKALNLPASAEDLRGPNRKLYEAEWTPPDRESLPLRLLAHSLFNPKNFDIACRSSSTWPYVDPDELLDKLLPGARKVRSAVGNHYIQRALDSVAYDYNEAEWKNLPQEERNTVLDALRGRLVQEEGRAVREIRQLLD
jgi:hypothetical protein